MRILVQALLVGVWIGGYSAWAQQTTNTLSPQAFERIDAHAHLLKDAPVLYELFERLNVRFLNICVVDKYERGNEEAAPQHAMALKVFYNSKGRAAWCSTFDPQDWETPSFSQRVVKELEQTFRDGAVAVKIYKSIGMELRSKSGKYLMPDDPVFDPILDTIAARNRTLFAHIAEPIAAWQPLDSASPDYGYYRTRPAWHMHGHPERPSKKAILAARDRMLKRHPNLRVVGCHLGSMEENVDDIGHRLEQYSNFAVDTAARIEHLALQNREKVRSFLMKYQDRVLYATDLVTNDWDNAPAAAKKWEAEYARDWRFFATEETIDFGRRKARGLALPEGVLRKLYRENALKWVPGILAAGRQP